MDPFVRPEHIFNNLWTFMESFLVNSPREQPCYESEQEIEKDLPELQDGHVLFGDNPDETFAIYTRIEQSNDFTEAVAPYLDQDCKPVFSVSLKYRGEEFAQCQLPFEAHIVKTAVDFKFTVRCNQKKFAALIAHLSCSISLLAAIKTSDATEKVLESDEIPFGSLAHTMASLSVCPFFQSNPKSTTFANSYVFLCRPSSLAVSETRADLRKLCTDCSEGSHLMTVLNEVKNSSATINLATLTNVAVPPIETKSVGSRSGRYDEEECPTPRDKSYEKIARVEGGQTSENPATSLVPVQGKGMAEMQEALTKLSLNRETSSYAKPAPYAKARGQRSRKVTTRMPIKRKYQRISGEPYLMKTLKKMQERLTRLEQGIKNAESACL